MWEYDDRAAYRRIESAVRQDPDLILAQTHRALLPPVVTSREEVSHVQHTPPGRGTVSGTASGTGGVIVRPLTEADLPEADRICRVVFGTYVGAAEPERFFGDADMVTTRWRACPSSVLAAEADGRLVGSNFAARWGSVAFFGPLSVDPAYWDRGVALSACWS